MGRKPIKVYQYDKYGNYLRSFPSLSEVARVMRSEIINISKVLNNKRRVRGCYFRTFEKKHIDENPYRIDGKPVIIFSKVVGDKISERVILWKQTRCIKEASQLTGIPHSTIRKYAKLKQWHKLGFFFMIIENK